MTLSSALRERQELSWVTVRERLGLDTKESPDCERSGPDHIMESLEQVSRESGVPIKDFCYAYDRSEGSMSELNRRAYALAALAAGVRVLPEFQMADIPCLVYGTARRKISRTAAITLKAVYESLRTSGQGTHQDVARHSGLAVSVVKSRMQRLCTAGLVRDVSQRDSGTSIVWTVTQTGFDDVFNVQDPRIPSIAPAVEGTHQRAEAA